MTSRRELGDFAPVILGLLLVWPFVVESTQGPGYGPMPEAVSSAKYLPGPPPESDSEEQERELCILNPQEAHNRRYEHQDESGTCCCSLCNPGSFARQLCKCSGFNEAPREFTKCERVNPGYFMPSLNKCSWPYRCTASCNANQTKVEPCSPTEDILCQCRDGWYDPHPQERVRIPRECVRKPLCRAGHGIVLQEVEGSNDIRYVCQPCQDGFFQKLDDSYDECLPHRECLVQKGNASTDNVCYFGQQQQQQDQQKQQQDQQQQPDQQQTQLKEQQQTQATTLEIPTMTEQTLTTKRSQATAEQRPLTGTGNVTRKCIPVGKPRCEPSVPVIILIGVLAMFLLGSLVANYLQYKGAKQHSQQLPHNYQQLSGGDKEGLAKCLDWLL